MKIKLLSFCFSLCFFLMRAQLPYVATPTIIPQNPTPASFIKVAVKVTTPNQGIIVDVNTFTVIGQQIRIKGCYWQGMATALQDYPDTLMIGQLPLGTYQVIQKAYLSSTQQHCSKIDSNMVTVPIQVSPVTGIFKNGGNEGLSVYPNPSSGNLFINGISGEAEAYIYSASGALIRKVEAMENKPVLIADLANGLYFIRFSNNKKIIKFVKYNTE